LKDARYAERGKPVEGLKLAEEEEELEEEEEEEEEEEDDVDDEKDEAEKESFFGEPLRLPFRLELAYD
jgi:CO dehydrogenase/acetyl-CoA synthase beta subunit